MAYIGKTPTAVPLTASDITDGIISTDKLADTSVTNAKLNANLISAETELATAPADTDELLISDAGVLKRIDASLVGGGGLSVADMWRLSSDYTFGTGDNVVDSNWEQIDSSGQNTVGSDMTESSGVFTFPSTGVWLVTAQAGFQLNNNARYVGIKISATFNGGGSYTNLTQKYTFIQQTSSSNTYNGAVTSTYLNVGNTSNDKVRFVVESEHASTVLKGSTGTNDSEFLFIKLN